MTKLKPCPFCGGEAHKKNSWSSGYKYIAVGCGSDEPCPAKNDEQDEQGGFSCDFSTEEEAINNWNTRPLEDKLNARVSELKVFIDRLIEAGNALDVPPDDFSEEQKEWREIVNDWRELEHD